MSDLENLFDDTLESEGDDPKESGLEEVLELIKPFVSVKSEENYQKLHEILGTLGVSNLSHVAVLEEKDLADVMKIADFRLMKLQISQSNLGKLLLLVYTCFNIDENFLPLVFPLFQARTQIKKMSKVTVLSLKI